MYCLQRVWRVAAQVPAWGRGAGDRADDEAAGSPAGAPPGPQPVQLQPQEPGGWGPGTQVCDTCLIRTENSQYY